MNNIPLHILLADDDDTDRLLFKEAFEELKIKTVVTVVNNGVQLMNYLKKKDAHLPSLLFLDLNMPRKGGLECLKEIRANEKLSKINIAIYSTSSSEEDIEETFRCGANVYIKKPNDFTLLKKVLEKTLIASYQYEAPPFNRDNFLLRL